MLRFSGGAPFMKKRIAQISFRAGCLVSVMAPIAAVVVYPRAKWLFGFVPIGVALLIYDKLTAKGPNPQEVADHAARLLSGAACAWDVDDYEHLDPIDPAVNDLLRRLTA